MKEWKNHIQGDTNIFIAIMTMVDPLDEQHDYAKYNINHGRRAQHDGGLLTSHYITGKDEYDRKVGFQSLDDVQLFIEQEIEKLKTMKDDKFGVMDTIKKNPDCKYKTNREECIAAWTFIYNDFVKAKNKGKLVTWEKAQEMYAEKVA